MKPYHEELSSKAWSVWQCHITQKHLLLKALYFWYVLKSIHNFIIELHALRCLFVRGSNKKQRRGSIISNFTNGETFSSLMTTKYSWGKYHNVVSLLVPLKKSLPLPFSLGKKRIYLDTQLKGELNDLFKKLPVCSLISLVGIGWWAFLLPANKLT